MARTPAAAALLFLLFTLLAVANCRPHEARPATDAESSSAAVAAAGDDENGPPNPTLAAEEVLPAAEQQHGFLRLPSHRLRGHRPCRHGPFHRHLWWAPRHDHGAFGDAPRRFHHHRHHVEALRRLPADETREAGDVKAVAEPDPDRSMIPESDGERERAVASTEPSFVDADGAGEQAAHEAGEGAAWKKEMLRRWVQFHHHRRHHGEDEEDMMTRRQFRHADDHDDDSEDEEVEEMVRRFRQAIMRRRFRGRFHHHHYGHRHGEEAEEEGGVVSWIKGLANWF